MPVGMNKCVFRTERRTFERSIITKWTFLLTREGKIKKDFRAEITDRVSCKSGYGELLRGLPANDGRDQLGSTGKLRAKTMIALPADQNRTHVKRVGN